MARSKPRAMGNHADRQAGRDAFPIARCQRRVVPMSSCIPDSRSPHCSLPVGTVAEPCTATGQSLKDARPVVTHGNVFAVTTPELGVVDENPAGRASVNNR